MSAEESVLERDYREAPLGEIPFLFLPERSLFARRAERFRFLCAGHPLRDYLAFLAYLADAQQAALNQFPAIPLPDAHEQARCREQGMSLLDVRSLRRNPAWRSGLDMILQEMNGATLPPQASETISCLMRTGEASLEQTADRIVAGDLDAVSPRELPLVAASLQVYFVQMASSLKKDAAGRLERGGLCPVCGSYPSVGIVRSGGSANGLRYLSCSLCSSQWHMVRIKCSSCESTRRIDYHILESSNGAIKAESCGDCNAYLKLLYLGKDPQMEATADDLATLSLDMLMDKEGKTRRGSNLFFHPGR